MRFSEAFTLNRTKRDDWFDPHLAVDTRLFIDPFRIFAEDREPWLGAHRRLIAFFNLVLGLVAQSGFTRASPHWKAAERLLVFPEPGEFCLGYAEASTRGAGSGTGLRIQILQAAESGIKAGLTSVRHFEELALFGEGFGADRISDIVGNVLKAEFIAYTQAVCRRHAVPMAELLVRNSEWSDRFRRWDSTRLLLPASPYGGRGVLLVPQRFLRDLPTIDQAGFWDWAWSNENETIRNELNYEIARSADTTTIIRLARMRPDIVEKYVRAQEKNPKPPYDLTDDPSWEVAWWEDGRTLGSRLPGPSAEPANRSQFHAFVAWFIESFRHNIEDQDGWRVLWRKQGPASERAVQAFFRSAVQHYCKANDIDLSAESNAGRGPVDFKFSLGWSQRALVELKLANNTNFWHGLEVQTPAYMRAEDVDRAYFLVICYRDGDLDKERLRSIRTAAAAYGMREGKKIQPRFVDAREKVSASRQRG